MNHSHRLDEGLELLYSLWERGRSDVDTFLEVCAEPGDDDARVVRMAEKLLAYRVFGDDNGRMNRSLADVGGQLLLVSQFTLAADTGSGLRPSFSTAAAPAEAERIYERLVLECAKRHPQGVETGRFRAHMEVSLVNDGPVTFLLRT